MVASSPWGPWAMTVTPDSGAPVVWSAMRPTTRPVVPWAWAVPPAATTMAAPIKPTTIAPQRMRSIWPLFRLSTVGRERGWGWRAGSVRAAIGGRRRQSVGLEGEDAVLDQAHPHEGRLAVLGEDLRLAEGQGDGRVVGQAANGDEGSKRVAEDQRAEEQPHRRSVRRVIEGQRRGGGDVGEPGGGR